VAANSERPAGSTLRGKTKLVYSCVIKVIRCIKCLLSLIKANGGAFRLRRHKRRPGALGLRAARPLGPPSGQRALNYEWCESIH